MPDVMDQLSDALATLFKQRQRALVSPAPGTGPESEIEDRRLVVEKQYNGTLPLGYLAAHPGKGAQATGFGGSGDAIIVDTFADQEVEEAAETETKRIEAVRRKLRNTPAAERIRLGKWFWLESHSDNTTGPTIGAFSLFDGTTGVPSAGNSVQQVTVALPAGTVSPVYLLDRYPGVFFMSIFVASAAFLPLGTTMTGVQEIWFSDIGGATAGLGIYNAASGNPYENINKQMDTPYTDPGTMTIGTLTFNNIGIGGTPVAVRWQLSIGYVGFVPDPHFNQQMMLPMKLKE